MSGQPPQALLPSSSESSSTAAGVGLGYGIAISVSILVLISTIMLASYACVRVKAGDPPPPPPQLRSINHIGRRRRSERPTDDEVEPVQIVVVGLDGQVVESYPKIVLGQSKRLPKPNYDGGVCCICLCEYEQNDMIRCVPGCNHCFHAECVDGWLRANGTCPTCRKPSAATSPLSESAPSNPR